MAGKSVRTAGLVPEPADAVPSSLEEVAAKFRGRPGAADEDAIAYVAADLQRRQVAPGVWRELSAHELLDLLDVPRAGSFLPYSLSERLTACARRAPAEPHTRPPAPVPRQAEPGPAAAVDHGPAVDVLTAIQAELAALRETIETLADELRERLEAVHEEVLTATGVLDRPRRAPGDVASAPVTRRNRWRTVLIVLIVLASAAVVAGVLVYGPDELWSDVIGLAEAWL